MSEDSSRQDGSRGPVAVTGATGFVGRYLVGALLERGWSVRALARDLGKAGRVLPDDDRVEIVDGDVFDDPSLDRLFDGAAACAHLIGIRCERPPRVTFERLHVEATRRALAWCRDKGVGRYVQMSALGTRPAARSAYHRTKHDAETLVRDSGLDWTIVRPSLIHGPDGEFIRMAKDWATGEAPPKLFMPYFEPPRAPMGETGPAGVSKNPTVQPVAVEDVAAAFVAALESDDAIGEVYGLGGPDRLSWPDMLREVRDALPGEHKKPVWGVPAEVGEFVARAGALLKLHALLPFCLSDVQMACEDSVTETEKVRRHLGIETRPFVETLRSYAAAV